MKKILVLFISVLLIAPITVFAANPAVLTLEASAVDATINYNGTIEDGSYATTCKLVNSKDEEIDTFSSSVDSNKFLGSFIAPSKGDYEVRCANYEGGDIKSVKVTVGEISTSNPTTGDNIVLYIVLSVVAITGLIAVSIILNKKKKSER